jgi:predicted dehydrogenase
MNKQINIGIVGLGEHMIRAHIQHLLPMSDVEILRWFDPNDKPSLSCFASLEKQPIRSSFEEILKDKQINVVFIGSPDQYHAEQLLACVQAGKSVFCEKPMAIVMDEREMLKEALFIASQNNLVISSCHPRRFDPPFVWLKERLVEDKDWVENNLGKITDFNFDFWYHEVTDEWKKDRSLLKDHFGHEIDLYRFLFGTSCNWKAIKESDSHDEYLVSRKSGDSMSPNFRFSGYRSLTEKVYQETVTIKGTKDALVMQLNSGKGIWMRDFESITFPCIDYEIRFKQVNENFIKAVQGKTSSYLTNKDMLVNNISSIELCAKGAYSIS